MADNVGQVIFHIVLTILVPPVSTLWIAGCTLDVFINFMLTVSGFVPGLVHAFYILHVYYQRQGAVQRGEIDPHNPPRATFVFSNHILIGSDKAPPAAELPHPATAGSQQRQQSVSGVTFQPQPSKAMATTDEHELSIITPQGEVTERMTPPDQTPPDPASIFGPTSPPANPACPIHGQPTRR